MLMPPLADKPSQRARNFFSPIGGMYLSERTLHRETPFSSCLALNSSLILNVSMIGSVIASFFKSFFVNESKSIFPAKWLTMSEFAFDRLSFVCESNWGLLNPVMNTTKQSLFLMSPGLIDLYFFT